MVTYNWKWLETLPTNFVDSCDACGVKIDDPMAVRCVKFPTHIINESKSPGYVIKVKTRTSEDSYSFQRCSGNYDEKQFCIVCDNRINQAAFDEFTKIVKESK